MYEAVVAWWQFKCFHKLRLKSQFLTVAIADAEFGGQTEVLPSSCVFLCIELPVLGYDPFKDNV